LNDYRITTLLNDRSNRTSSFRRIPSHDFTMLLLPADSFAQIEPPVNSASISGRSTLDSHPLQSFRPAKIKGKFGKRKFSHQNTRVMTVIAPDLPHCQIHRNSWAQKRELLNVVLQRTHTHLIQPDGHVPVDQDHVALERRLRRQHQKQRTLHDRSQPIHSLLYLDHSTTNHT